MEISLCTCDLSPCTSLQGKIQRLRAAYSSDFNSKPGLKKEEKKERVVSMAKQKHKLSTSSF